MRVWLRKPQGTTPLSVVCNLPVLTLQSEAWGWRPHAPGDVISPMLSRAHDAARTRFEALQSALSARANVKLINTCSRVRHRSGFTRSEEKKKKKGKVALWQFEATVSLYSAYAWLALTGSSTLWPLLISAFLWSPAVRRNQPCCRVSSLRRWCWTPAATRRQDYRAYSGKALLQALLFSSDGLKHVWWNTKTRQEQESGWISSWRSTQ